MTPTHPTHATLPFRMGGYVRRGRTRVTLALTVTLQHGRLGGVFLLRDPAARLDARLVRFQNLRRTGQGIVARGLIRVGRRAVRFVLDVEVTHRGTILLCAIPSLRYRLYGALYNQSSTHSARGRSSPHSARGKR